jgi:hypothetical protein
MLTCGFGTLAIGVVNGRQFDAIQGNIGREMSFVEDLSSPHTPHTESLVAHNRLSCWLSFQDGF